MDSTLNHEANSRFDALEERLKAIEEHLFGDKEEESTEETVETEPEPTPETEEHTEV
jgi:hypothetical protein